MAEAFDIRDLSDVHVVRRANRPDRAPRAACCNAIGQPRRLMLICGLGCTAVLAIFIVILISLGSLEPTQYGLRYNRVSKQVDSSYVYHGGRHLIGPVSSFLAFPATVQNIEFSSRSSATAPPLSTRTAEGLGLILHVAFQYHLEPNQIPKLYRLANTNYESLYMKVAKDILLKAAAQFNAPQYWMNRTEVGQEMLRLVNGGLQSSYASCTGLQLLVIELPDKYEDSIVATQVQKQGIKTKENEQQAAVIRAEIDVMVADYQNKITVIINGAHADANLVMQSAAARASQMKIQAENTAFGNVTDILNFSAPSLVGYQRNFAYQTISNATFLFGVPNAVVVIGANGASGQDHSSSASLPACEQARENVN